MLSVQVRTAAAPLPPQAWPCPTRLLTRSPPCVALELFSQEKSRVRPLSAIATTTCADQAGRCPPAALTSWDGTASPASPSLPTAATAHNGSLCAAPPPARPTGAYRARGTGWCGAGSCALDTGHCLLLPPATPCSSAHHCELRLCCYQQKSPRRVSPRAHAVPGTMRTRVAELWVQSSRAWPWEGSSRRKGLQLQFVAPLAKRSYIWGTVSKKYLTLDPSSSNRSCNVPCLGHCRSLWSGPCSALGFVKPSLSPLCKTAATLPLSETPKLSPAPRPSDELIYHLLWRNLGGFVFCFFLFLLFWATHKAYRCSQAGG